MAIKDKRAFDLKRKYASLRNAGLDSTISRKAKHWSEEKILIELGVKVNKTIPKIKERPTDPKKLKSYYTRKTRERNKVIYAISIGLKAKEATKLKKFKKGRIEATKDYKEQRNLKPSEYRKPKSREARIELWEDWSKADNLPPEIHEQAMEINRNTYMKRGIKKIRYIPLDDTDKYGYMIAYYMFILDISEDQAKEQNPVDNWSGDLYKDNLAELL